tara:strand:+ start:403 stop:1632 length:1230 start_codon:yes stop_codon:yes gene_type:complete
MGMVVGLGVSIFLGRTIGAEGLGIINLANQITSLLLVFAILGFTKVIIKDVAIAYNKQNFKKVNDVIYTSYIINGFLSIIITTVLILISGNLANDVFKIHSLKYPLIIAAITFTPQIISRTVSAALVGYKKIWQSNLVDQTLSTVVTGTVLLTLYLINVNIDVITVAITYGVGRLVVTLSMLVYWKYLNRKNKKQKPAFIGKEMFSRGIPLLIVSASLLISSNADTLMLGWLSTAKEVGLYNIAAKLALLTSFLLQITVSTIAPKIAVLYEKGEIKELEVLVQRITAGLTWVGLLSLGIFIFFGKFILKFWGVEFTTAYSILVILAIGQFFNIASGPIGNILIMTNHEKLIRNVTIFTVLLNLLMNYFLIKDFQGMGAALATSTTTILNMIICYYYVRKKVGLKIIKFL